MQNPIRGLFRPRNVAPPPNSTFTDSNPHALMGGYDIPEMPVLEQTYGPEMMQGLFMPPILDATVTTPSTDISGVSPDGSSQTPAPAATGPSVDGTPDEKPNAMGLTQRLKQNQMDASSDRARQRRDALTSYDEMDDQQLLDYAAGFGTDETINAAKSAGIMGHAMGFLDDWNLRETMSNRFGQDFQSVDDAVAYAQANGGQARELNPVDKFVGGVRNTVDNIFKPVREAVQNVSDAVTGESPASRAIDKLDKANVETPAQAIPIMAPGDYDNGSPRGGGSNRNDRNRGRASDLGYGSREREQRSSLQRDSKGYSGGRGF